MEGPPLLSPSLTGPLSLFVSLSHMPSFSSAGPLSLALPLSLPLSHALFLLLALSPLRASLLSLTRFLTPPLTLPCRLARTSQRRQSASCWPTRAPRRRQGRTRTKSESKRKGGKQGEEAQQVWSMHGTAGALMAPSMCSSRWPFLVLCFGAAGKGGHAWHSSIGQKSAPAVCHHVQCCVLDNMPTHSCCCLFMCFPLH